MANHRECKKCEEYGAVVGAIALAGVGVALFCSGGHAIAGAILAVGIEIAETFARWVKHQGQD